jgi:hypothetical protein
LCDTFDKDVRFLHNELMPRKPGRLPKLQAILEAARNRFRARGGIPHETFWKEVEADNTGRTGNRSGRQKKRPNQTLNLKT